MYREEILTISVCLTCHLFLVIEFFILCFPNPAQALIRALIRLNMLTVTWSLAFYKKKYDQFSTATEVKVEDGG